MTVTIPAAIQRGLPFQTVTENGAVTPESTGDAQLDLFSKVAACRNNLPLAQELFKAALGDNLLTAFQIMFWTRNCRGGQGERAVFRTLLKDAAAHNAAAVISVLPLVAKYGRWDDVLCLEGTEVWPHAMKLMSSQLKADMETLVKNGVPSLLAKWLPSANASSKETKRLARLICSDLGWNERTYRKTLVALRKQIQIVEHAMCSGDWGSIDYSRVPSKAMNMYRKAFAKRDSDRFTQFLADVKAGKTKINAGTLFPYELVKPYLGADAGLGSWINSDPGQAIEVDEVLEAQWKALPNMMPETPFNGLVVADVSGSMMCDDGLPMAVSISLALYLAERNTSPAYANRFLTFTDDSKLEMVKGETLAERVHNLSRADWGGSTNLVSAFQRVLESAQTLGLSQEQLPQKLIIVSDMEFNMACESNDESNFQYIKKMYADAGYTAPQLVFWNVAAHGNQAPFTTDESGNAQLVSGCSPSILKAVLEGNSLTARQLMDEVLVDYADVLEALLSS